MEVTTSEMLRPWQERSFGPDIVAHRHRAEQIEQDAERVHDEALEVLFAADPLTSPDVMRAARLGLDRRFAAVLERTQPLTTFNASADAGFRTAIRDADNDLISVRLRDARIATNRLERFVAQVVTPFAVVYRDE